MPHLNNDICAVWNPARVHVCFAQCSSDSVLLKITWLQRFSNFSLFLIASVTMKWTNRILSDLQAIVHWLSAGVRMILPCVMQRLLHFSSGTTLSNRLQWKLISYSCCWSLASCTHEEFFAGYFMDIRVFHRLAQFIKHLCVCGKPQTFYCNFRVIRLLARIGLV